MTPEEFLDKLFRCADLSVPPRPAHLRFSAEELRAILAAKTPEERQQLEEIGDRAYQEWLLANESDEDREQQHPDTRPP